jgi:hypothetical protein
MAVEATEFGGVLIYFISADFFSAKTVSYCPLLLYLLKVVYISYAFKNYKMESPKNSPSG